MIVDKGKRLKVDEEFQNEVADEHINKELLFSIDKLQKIQEHLEKINDKASDKVLEVEQKYSMIRRPIYNKRANIVKSIPDFWLTSFTRHPALNELLTEQDQKIFKYLKSIEVEETKDVKSGYSIAFFFNPNPYFEETKLMKSFYFLEESTKMKATPITWKEGMGMNNGINNEKIGDKRPLADQAEESFFTWFRDSEDDDEYFMFYDEVAEFIKDDLWINPLMYYNNVGEEENADDEENGGEDDDESENDDESEE